MEKLSDDLKNISDNIDELADVLRKGSIVSDIEVYKDVADIFPNIFPGEFADEMKRYYVKQFQQAIDIGDYESVADLLKICSLSLHIFSDIYQYKDKFNKLILDRKRMAYTNEVYLKHRRKHAETTISNPWFGNGKKGVYVTAITGGYDDLQDPEVIDEKMDYICFSDGKIYDSKVWKTVVVDNSLGLDNIRLARYYKIMTHKILAEYDYCIWIDGKIKVIGDINEYISRFSFGSSLLCFPHYDRDCIYEEALVCMAIKKGKPEEIVMQIGKYRDEGYPEHNGLIDSGFMVKSLKDEKLNAVMEDWWNEVSTKSTRDQLSFNYVVHKNHFQYDMSGLFIYNNEYLTLLNSH